MSDEPNAILHPELVFGIAGPIGIDIDTISQTLSQALQAVEYRTVNIRITAEIENEITDVTKSAGTDYEAVMAYKHHPQNG